MQQPINRKEHWNHVYQTKAHDDVSWYQSRPATSLKLIEACGVGKQEGSVATLQVARDRLAACSSWPLRFAVYSSGGNLSRRSSCWQWGGTCAFPFRTASCQSGETTVPRLTSLQSSSPSCWRHQRSQPSCIDTEARPRWRDT